MQKMIVHGSFDSEGVPEYSSPQASGADIKALLQEDIEIPPGERATIPTGIRLQIPQGFEAQIRPRSGLAQKNGITVLNTPGTIDADYRGEIKIILINLGDEVFTVSNKMKIAQIVFSPVIQAEFYPSDSLSETIRGEGGFGSTDSV
ncbi:MAG: dUTP diphosphatase [Spirochaetaceae bacterium]